jgi:hypothetical protein
MIFDGAKLFHKNPKSLMKSGSKEIGRIIIPAK